tara:strand:- start:1383 stop:1505 length:123 start_codon:yes stop_codon:yes gene_type:complete
MGQIVSFDFRQGNEAAAKQNFEFIQGADLRVFKEWLLAQF